MIRQNCELNLSPPLALREADCGIQTTQFADFFIFHSVIYESCPTCRLKKDFPLDSVFQPIQFGNTGKVVVAPANCISKALKTLMWLPMDLIVVPSLALVKSELLLKVGLG